MRWVGIRIVVVLAGFSIGALAALAVGGPTPDVSWHADAVRAGCGKMEMNAVTGAAEWKWSTPATAFYYNPYIDGSHTESPAHGGVTR